MGLFQQKVANTLDNAFRWPGPFSAWYTGSLELGHPLNLGGGDDVERGFVRWRNVTIPAGSTITSAYLKLARWYDSTLALALTVVGIDEDNTADFTSDASGRSTTSASVNWTPSSSWTDDVYQTSPDIKTIIQEIVDRGGWSSGNSLGLRINDNGTATYTYGQMVSYTSAGTSYAELVVNYTGGSSPSASQSPSSSISLSPSRSPSLSPSVSESPSPSPLVPFFGMRVAKTGKDVLATDNPGDLIFDSDYGTLKYFSKQTIETTIDANAGDIATAGSYSHNLGYYPFVEVFVNVYIGTSDGTYEYCPFFGSGATVAYSANYKLTTTGITVYADINGVSSSLWHFDFLIFIYKNNLQLS